MNNPPRSGERDRSAQPSGGGGQVPPRHGEGDRQPQAGGGGGPPLDDPQFPKPLQAPIKTVKRARKLRKAMSLPEVLLWQELRKRPGDLKFRRQHPELTFVHDFCCLKARLLIEVDGASHGMGDQPAYDHWRDAIALERGYRTLRIPARIVLKDIEEAVKAIVAACRDVGPLHRPTDGPPPRAGEDLNSA